MDFVSTTILLCVGIITFLTGASGIGTHNIYSSGCNNERIFLDCPDAHKIAIKRLYYGVKEDRKCAAQGRNHSIDCCEPTYNDCLVVNDEKYPVLNMYCSGHSRCDIKANSISSGPTCSNQPTDYMTVIHDCIPDADVSNLCSDGHKRGKILYLSNRNYPHPITGGVKECQCMISAGSTKGLDIHALDILITRSQGSNGCLQEIKIRDTEGIGKVITCGHAGYYGFRPIYNKDVKNVTLTLSSRSPETGGYVWLQTKASDPDDYVEIHCGNSIRKFFGYDVSDDSESRTVVVDPDETDKIPDDKSSKDSQKQTPKVVSDMVALIAGIAVAVALVVIIGIVGIIILCVRMHRNRGTNKHIPPFPSPMLKAKDDKHSASYCKYDYDEDDKYCSIKRSPMRVSKFDMDLDADQKLRDAFLQGVAQGNVTQPEYINYKHSVSSPDVPLLANSADSAKMEEDNVIMPKSEYIVMGTASQPNSMMREITISTLPEKRKLKNKTVTFSPVAMVTPLPSGSEESVPEDEKLDDLKGYFHESYSKSLPLRSNISRSLPPSEKTKKVVIYPPNPDDVFLPTFKSGDCANVTEEDLWKAFHIKLDETEKDCDNLTCNSDTGYSSEPHSFEDYVEDENPYDNVPSYTNTVDSLQRHKFKQNGITNHKPPIPKKPESNV